MEDIVPLQINPGVQRDGTRFSHGACVDAQWCRFHYGKPRKMGGYQQLYGSFPDIFRGAHVVSKDGTNNYYLGSANNLYVVPVDNTGAGAGVIDRTPSGFSASPDNVWQFDDMYDSVTTAKVIFAHAGQNLTNIDSAMNSPVYYGDVSANSALTSIGQSVSGGVCCLHPYVFVYGNDGIIQWAAAGTANNFSGGDTGNARITGSKIVTGHAFRGGSGNAPAGLFWSLDSLHRIYFVGGSSVFANDTVGDTNILSSRAAVEYGGLYYWPCSDRHFSMYNSSIYTLPNAYNQDFFFDNLNMKYRQKVWGTKVPAFNEIWWFAPLFGATECNWALCFNVKDQTWYDTPINRSCGIHASVFPYPVWMDSQANPGGTYSMYRHEYGVDAVVGTQVNAIKSYFESPIISMVDKQNGADKWVWLEWFEPDFVQSGDLMLEVTGEDYPQSTTTLTSDVYTIAESGAQVDTKFQRRLLRVRVTSNEAGGYYYMGKPLMKVTSGNARQWK